MSLRTALFRSLLAGTVVVSIATARSTAAGSSPRPATVVVSRAAPLPAGWTRVGPDRAAAPLTLGVVLAPREPAALTRFVEDVATPGATGYRRYLARGAFAGRFGPSTSTVEAVEAALRGLGLDELRLSADRLLLTVRTTVGRAEAALGTTLVQLRARSGALGYANASAARLPAAVAGDVVAVLGLSDVFRLQPAIDAASRRPLGARSSGASPDAAGPSPCTAATSDATTADALASAYGLGGLYAHGDLGEGQTIGLFEPAAYSTQDVAVYQRCYRTATSVADRPVDGGASIGNGTLEATSDVEDLIGLAPRARILVYETSNLFEPDWLDAWARIVDDDAAQVISTSWSGCEPYEPSGFAAAEALFFEQAAAQGQTVLAASGDDGAEACRALSGATIPSVNDPASDPYVTAVGGTQWPGRGRSGERAWDSSTGASGGGVSQVWAMPSWQRGPGVLNRYTTSLACHAVGEDCREVPDVAALAGAPYYAFYCTVGDCRSVGGWGYFWGTSFATPLWAASLALVNESCAPGPAVGLVSPSLYALAAFGPSPLHDVIAGGVDAAHPGDHAYPATRGYDLSTGLGTPAWTTGTAVLGLAGRLCLLGQLPSLAPGVIVAAPSDAASSPVAELSAVACPAIDGCAAVGAYTDAAQHGEALTSVQTAGGWHQARVVDPPLDAAVNPDAALSAIACTAIGRCAAVGSFVDTSGRTEAMAATEAAGTWATATEVTAPINAAPSPDATLRAVTCITTGDCVGVGSYVDTAGRTETMVATETAGTWAVATELAAPSGAAGNPDVVPSAVECTSRGTCEAVGSFVDASGHGQAWADGAAGSTWSTPTPVRAPVNGAADPAATLSALSCASASSCEGVGAFTTSGGAMEGMTALEYDGVWRQAKALAAPVGAATDPLAGLGGVSCTAIGSCLAVGGYAGPGGSTEAMSAEERGGVWTRATRLALPEGTAGNPRAALRSVACTTTGACTAVGTVTETSSKQVPMATGALLASITRLAPARGPTAGGSTVAIIGAGVASVHAVRFGRATGHLVGIVSAREIEVTAPAGSGTVNVTVVTASGTSLVTASDRYRYVRASPRRPRRATASRRAGGT